MNKFIEWIKQLFGAVGVIWSTLKNSWAGSVVIKAMANTQLQAKAFELVEALQDSGKTGAEKEAAFNAAFNAFCDAEGYTVTKSMVNCLRELALAAYQARQESIR